MLGSWRSRATATGLVLAASVHCGRTALDDAGVGAQVPAGDARAETGGHDPADDAALAAKDTWAEADRAPSSAWVDICRKRLAGVDLGASSDVQALAVGEDDTVYLAGGFTRMGPLMGGGVSFALPEGQPTTDFDRVAGDVYAVVSDGSGGWFIGGWFDHVGALPRQNLAHVDANGRADASFRMPTNR